MPPGPRTTPPPPGCGDAAGRRWRVAALGTAVCLTTARALYPSENADVSGDGVPVVCMWLLLAAAWLFVSRRHGVSAIRWTAADWLLAAAGGWIAVSCLVGGGVGVTRAGLNMLWEWLGLLTGFFLLRQLLRRPEEVRAAVASQLAVAVVLSLFGFYQSLVQKPAVEAEFRRDPDAALVRAGVNAPEGSPERAMFMRRLEDRSPEASFALANSFAGFLVPWIVLAVAAAVPWLGSARQGAATDRGRLLALAVLVAPVVLCLLLTNSRSGQAAATLGAAVAAWMATPPEVRSRRRVRALLAGGGALLLVVGLAAAAFRPSIATSAARTLLFRVHYWQASANLIGDSWMFGCGPGRFQETYARYKLPQASETVADPHNWLVEVAATAGLPAAGMFAAAVVLLLRRGWRNRETVDAAAPSGAARHVLVGACAAFLLAWFLSPLATVSMSTAFFIVGLFVAAIACEFQTPWIQTGRLAPQSTAIAAAALLLHLSVSGGVAYAGVAGSLWLLLAAGCTDDATDSAKPPVAAPWPLAAAAVLLVGLCYWFGFRPAVGAGAALKQAAAAAERGAIPEVETWLRRAEEFDPLAPEPPRQLAQIAFQRWRRGPSDAAWEAFVARQDVALRRDAASAPAWREAGRRYLVGWRTQADPARLAAAVAALERAATLHPASAAYRAELAWALHLAGESTRAEAEATQAAALDAMHDHVEHKLEQIRPLDPAAAAPHLEQLIQPLRSG